MERITQPNERPILFSAPMVRAILAGTKTQTRRTVKKPGCQCGTWNPSEMDATTPEGWQTVGHSGRWWCDCCTSDQDAVMCPYGKPGDRLWVREGFAIEDDAQLGFPPPFSDGRPIVRSGESGWEQPHYKATDPHPDLTCGHEKCVGGPCERPWRSPLFMPRWASRITLEIVSVRVERLQEISREDAITEGVEVFPWDDPQTFWKNYLFKTAHPKRGDEVTDDYHRTKAFGSPVESYRTLWESINGPGSWAANPWVWIIEFRKIANREEGYERVLAHLQAMLQSNEIERRDATNIGGAHNNQHGGKFHAKC